MFEQLLNLAGNVGHAVLQQKKLIATAESCTGGQIAYLLTSIAGSSEWFERGYVTYSNEAKAENLGVPMHTIDEHGAVSQVTALAMAEGVLANSNADISVVTTGVAGPGGGSEAKPIGTVWIACCLKGSKAEAEKFLFQGDRLSIRDQACEKALLRLSKLIEASNFN